MRISYRFADTFPSAPVTVEGGWCSRANYEAGRLQMEMFMSKSHTDKMTDTEKALFAVLQEIVTVLRKEPKLGSALKTRLSDLEASYMANNIHRGPGGWVVRRLQSIAFRLS